VGGVQVVDRVVAKEFRVVVSVLLGCSRWVECLIRSKDITMRYIPPSSTSMGFLKMFSPIFGFNCCKVYWL